MKTMATRRHLLILASALAVLAGCDPGGDPPSIARIVIETAPAEPLELIVSTNFTTVTDTETGNRIPVFFSSDTTAVSGDYDEETNMVATRRIYVRVTNAAATAEQVHMRIFFDGELRYETDRSIADGEELQFLYTGRFVG